MAGARQPIDLVVAKGNKHLSKAEIEERRAREIKPCSDEIKPPKYLTAGQKKRFNTLARQLGKIKIMGETDVDTLARYVVVQELFEDATAQLRDMAKPEMTGEAREDMDLLESWVRCREQIAKQHDRYFKQAQAAASSLGLTITSRCKIEVPVTEEEPKTNKFAKFGKAAVDE